MNNLNPTISKDIFRKSRTPIFIITIFLMVFSLMCPQVTQGGDIYTYTDKNGVPVITNTPIPEKYQNKAEKIDAYKDLSPSQRGELEREGASKQEQYRQQEIAKEKESIAKENELKCYTVQSGGVMTGGTVTGRTMTGVVSGGSFWYICKDKNGKIVSKTRL